MKHLFLVTTAVGCFIAGHVAAATTIDFEDLAIGATLSSQYAGLGVTFTPNAFSGAGSSSSGEAWASNSDLTIVSATGSDVGGLGTPTLVSGHILHSFNAWLGEDGDPSLLATFSTPISLFGATFAGVSTAADVTLYAFNGPTLLSTVNGTIGTGQFNLSISAASITKVAIRYGSFNDWVGVDNVSFTPTAVPESSPVAGYALGFAVFCVAGRRSLRRTS